MTSKINSTLEIFSVSMTKLKTNKKGLRRALFHLIENEKISGGVNLVMPEAPTNSEFIKTLGKTMKRPTLFSVPAIALKIALGEFSSEVLGSVRVAPGKLIVNNFNFENNDLSSALHFAIKN